MDKNKQAKLASKGWKIGTVNEFLELTPAEATYIELRLALSENLNINVAHKNNSPQATHNTPTLPKLKN